MIEVENLTKYYGPIKGIEDISFKIEKGDVVGLLGPNGSGKTTAMRILTCFFPPTRGRAFVYGYDVTKTILLDIMPATAVERKARGRDRFERDLGLLGRLRESYLRQAGAAGWLRIDGEGSRDEVTDAVVAGVSARLGPR